MLRAGAAFLLVLGGAWCVCGQELEISVSPSPVGSGGRAAGMADAFVAVADDATAASWNPAGLVQLERPEFSIVGSFNGVLEEFDVKGHDETTGSHEAYNVDLNYFSFAYPLPILVLGRNSVVSLNYQRKYDFSRKFTLDYDTTTALNRGGMLNAFRTMKFKQDGGLSALSPAFAFEITHRISFGMAVNIWTSTPFAKNTWEQTIDYEQTNLLTGSAFCNGVHTKARYEDFHGVNCTLGLLWNITDRWSVGARYDTAFTGEARYKETTWGYNMTVATGGLTVNSNRYNHKRKIRFPATVAAGVAWRPIDRLTLSFDVTRTDWNDYWVKDQNGVRHSLVDYSNLDEPVYASHFDPTYTVRLGTEYVFLPKHPEEKLRQLWAIRGGLFYDQEPGNGKKKGPDGLHKGGDGYPDNFYGFALGGGVQLLQHVNLDLAYQLRCGHHVNSDFIRGIDDFQEDVFQHRLLLSTVVYF